MFLLSMNSDSLTVFSSRPPKYEAHRPSPAIHQVIVGGDYKDIFLVSSLGGGMGPKKTNAWGQKKLTPGAKKNYPPGARKNYIVFFGVIGFFWCHVAPAELWILLAERPAKCTRRGVGVLGAGLQIAISVLRCNSIGLCSALGSKVWAWISRAFDSWLWLWALCLALSSRILGWALGSELSALALG